MRLQSLIASNDGWTVDGQDVDITGLTEDSRKVTAGNLFIAIPGTKQDGRQFIADAAAKGAVAVLLPAGAPLPEPRPTQTVVRVGDIRTATAKLAARFYPDQPSTIAAVTGTSGKTSTAQFAREIWQHLDHASASIGTLGLVTSDGMKYGSLTTPDAITLHKQLHECAHDGITHLAMEASSHGLDMHRLDKVRLKAASFTNLSRDHLDYHPDMESYLAAKMRLFSDLLPAGSTAILNADIPEYAKLHALAAAHNLKIISYGRQGQDLTLVSVTPVAGGQQLTLRAFGQDYNLLLPVIGGFQAYNALCALGMVIGSGDDVAASIKAASKITGVPGRLQHIGTTHNGASVFVDYAHKPDALANVLHALRPHVASTAGAKLGVVVGCGGNRDAGKRPIMGGIATDLADWTIVTDDNPRNEEPAAIRREVLAGCKTGSDITEIGDRAKAIHEAIHRLQSGDVLVIAGKGHEHGQIVGTQTLPFDDADVARGALS